MKLVIQIPCFNEEKYLAKTLKDLPQKLPGISEIEVVVINDGSKDNTVNIAKKHGVKHFVDFKNNRGLSCAFMAGINKSLELGADIIVNTDADNQYPGKLISELIKPIIDGSTDISIGDRQVSNIPNFSYTKKTLQKLGSYMIRKLSNTNVIDAPCGFRAYTKDAAMRLNILNNYTYTLESIIQAGHQKLVIANVPISINKVERPSRLFKNNLQYVVFAFFTAFKAFMSYQPLKTFSILAILFEIPGISIGIWFSNIYLKEGGAGHIQILILSAILILIGCILFIGGLLSENISVNRKHLEELLYREKQNLYGK